MESTRFFGYFSRSYKSKVVLFNLKTSIVVSSRSFFAIFHSTILQRGGKKKGGTKKWEIPKGVMGKVNPEQFHP